MKKKQKKLLLILIILLVIFVLTFVVILSKCYETIILSEKNTEIIIKKNKLCKSAVVKVESKMTQNQLVDVIFNTTKVSTELTCGMLQATFFKEDDLESLFEQWAEIKVESEEVSKKNVLEGYEVKNVKFILSEKESGNRLSKCYIKGKEESDLVIEYAK